MELGYLLLLSYVAIGAFMLLAGAVFGYRPWRHGWAIAVVALIAWPLLVIDEYMRGHR